MTLVKELLEITADMGKDFGVGIYERFVLEHGQEFLTILDLSDKIERGQPKLCFGNAALIACSYPDQYAYTEGYATTKSIPLAMQHAWLTDRQGNVIDPTWEDSKNASYYGILFKHEYVRPRMGLSLIDDYENKWPLLNDKTPENHMIELKNWISHPA